MRRDQLLFIVLIFVWKCVSGCYHGIQSSGVTSPEGDLDIATGDNLVINCTINNNLTDTRNANEIIWRLKGKNVDRRHVTVLDNRTAELKLCNVNRTDAGWYTCYLDATDRYPLTSLCVNAVTVGDRLQKVSDFKCISMEWKNMTCTWKAQHCGIKNNWTLKFNNKMGFANCPKYLKDDQDEVYGCFFSEDTDPPYPDVTRLLYFTLHGENSVSETHANFKVEHYKRVVAPAPINVRILDYGVNELKVDWENNPEFKLFPDPTIFRVSYRSTWDPKDHWNVINVTNGTSVILTDLNPWTEYTVMVRRKVRDAPDVDEMWSQGVTNSRKTIPMVPNAVVEMSTDGFDDVNVDMNQRNVTIFWKPLPESEYNGPNFHYIARVYFDGKELLKHIKSKQNFSATFTHLEQRKLYTFTVQAANDVGAALNFANISVSDTDNKLPDIPPFNVIYFDEGVYEISWKSINDSAVDNYVIFWCKSSQVRADLCQESPSWTVVGSKLEEYNVSVPDHNSNYRFAVSASGPNISSGMIWSKCIAPYDGVVGKIKMLPLKAESPTEIRVSWLLDCSDRLGIILGFQIMYCVQGSNGCLDGQENETISGSHVTSFILKNLRPYTNYSVRVAARTKSGKLGELGDAEVERTLESTPDSPTHLTEVAVTNTSITIEWQPPESPNGVIVKYFINYNGHMTVLKPVNNSYTKFTEVIERAIESYANYTVRVKACTIVNCSNYSDPLTVTTLVGVPGEPEEPHTSRINETHAMVQWKSPKNPNGPIDYWELLVEQYKDANYNDSEQIGNSANYTTDKNSQIIAMNCNTQTVYKLAVRAVNLIPDRQCQQLLANSSAKCEAMSGPYSEKTKLVCVPDSFSATIIGIIASGVVFGGILLLLGCCYLVRSCNAKFRELKKIKVEIPAGLMNNQLNASKILYPEKGSAQNHYVSTAPIYDRLQSISSDEGRTSQSSQSSTETTVDMTLSISSAPEDTPQSDLDRSIKQGMSSPSVSLDSGNESDPAPSPDSVFYDSVWSPELSSSRCQLRYRNKTGEEQELAKLPQKADVPNYSKFAMQIANMTELEPYMPDGSEMGTTEPNRSPISAYSRVGVPKPTTVNYVSVDDVAYTSKLPKTDVQAGYSKVAQYVDSGVSTIETHKRPATGYVMADSIQRIDDDDSRKSNQVKVTNNLYLGVDPNESEGSNQGQGYISIDTRLLVKIG